MCKSLKATYKFNYKTKLRDCSHIMSSQRGAGVCGGGREGSVGGGGWGGVCIYIAKRHYEKTKKVELILVKT